MSADQKIEIVRDKGFAKRLETACESHPHAPSQHGRQKWVREQMAERFGLSLSPEAVSKWFKGVARPRPTVMRKLAALLEVDEAWLALGITPDTSVVDQRKRNAIADGAVNLVAGLIQISGGNIAFPDESAAEDVDLFAIIRGRQYAVEVKLGKIDGETVRFSLPRQYERFTVLGVIPSTHPTAIQVLRLPTALIKKHARSRGGYAELNLERKGSHFVTGDDKWPVIRDFDDLDGETPKATKSAGMRALDL